MTTLVRTLEMDHQDGLERLRKRLLSDVVRTTWAVRPWLSYDYFKATGDPVTLKAAAVHLSTDFPEKANCIIAPGLGALSLATAISLELSTLGRFVPVLSVRDPKKSREGEKLVQGPVPDHPIAVYVDDTVVSGATYDRTVATVKELAPDLMVLGLCLLVDPKHLNGSRRMIASGVKIRSCFTKHSLGVSSDDVVASIGGPRQQAVIGEPLLDVDLSIHGLSFEHQASVPKWYKGSILVGDCRHNLALIGGQGELLWRHQYAPRDLKGITQDLLITGSEAFVAGYCGTLARVPLDSGVPLWEKKLAGCFHSTPKLQGGLLYLTSEDVAGSDASGWAESASLIVVNVNGDVQYTKRFSDRVAPCTPAVTGKYVVVIANDNILRCLVRDAVIWEFQLEGSAFGSVLAPGDTVFVADDHGFVYSLRASTGEVLWKKRTSTSFFHTVPAIHGGRLILSDSNIYTHALNLKTGDREWLVKTRSQVPWRPMVMGRYIVLVGQDGDVCIVDPVSGMKRRETRLQWGNAHARQPGDIHGTNLAVVTTDSHLRVYNLCNT